MGISWFFAPFSCISDDRGTNSTKTESSETISFFIRDPPGVNSIGTVVGGGRLLHASPFFGKVGFFYARISVIGRTSRRIFSSASCRETASS
jgi:hypothetical protein